MTGWLRARGYAVLQLVGLGLIVAGVSFLFGWPVGLIAAGVVLVVLGVLSEMTHAGSSV